MGQVGQSIGKLTISCGFRMAPGAIKDLKGSAQLATDSLEVLAMSTVSAGGPPVAICTGPLRVPREP